MIIFVHFLIQKIFSLEKANFHFQILCMNFESTSNLKLLLSCLSSLTVRNEYCQAVVKEHGGLKCILDLLIDSNKHNKGIVTEALKLLKTLAGNDNVKKEIGESNGIHIIISAINNYVVGNQ